MSDWFAFCLLIFQWIQLIYKVGLCISLWDILEIGESFISDVDASYHTQGKYFASHRRWIRLLLHLPPPSHRVVHCCLLKITFSCHQLRSVLPVFDHPLMRCCWEPWNPVPNPVFVFPWISSMIYTFRRKSYGILLDCKLFYLLTSRWPIGLF